MIPPDFVAYIRPLSTTEAEPRWGHRNGFTPELACHAVAKNAGINIVGFIEENQDGNKTLIDLIDTITFGRMMRKFCSHMAYLFLIGRCCRRRLSKFYSNVSCQLSS